MVYRYYVDAAVECAFIRHTGQHQVNDGLNALRETAASPGYRPGFNILHDYRLSGFTEQANLKFFARRREFQKELDALLGPIKIALLVDRNVDYGVFRQLMVVISEDRLQRRPFRELDKALDWLGVPADYQIKDYE